MIFPTTCLTHGSILKSPTHINLIKDFLLNNDNVASLPLTDICNVSQCYEYWKTLKSIDKKPVLGCQIPLCNTYSEVREDNPTLSLNLVLYAKNLDGWKQILSILHFCNHPDRIFDTIRISPEEINAFCLKDIVVLAPSRYNKFFDYKKDFIYNDGTHKGSNFKALHYAKNQILLKSHSNRLNAILKKAKIKDGASQDACLDLNKYNKESIEIFNQIEDFDITYKEEFPPFSDDDVKLLRYKCWDGLKTIGKDQDQVYIDRVKKELNVFCPKGFAGYFLIMADALNYMSSQGYINGVGRGSSAGCLMNYLLGVTGIDPIKNDLMFERFYTDERNDMPDIDSDVQPSKRPELIQYLEDKYGADRFAQLSAFGTIKGAGALKLTLGNSGMGFGMQNAITERLPKEGVVDPELVAQKNECGTRSLVLYVLKNHPTKFEEWARLNKDGSISGRWANEFQLAIDLDETIVSKSKHASAFILSKNPIHEQAPVEWDSSLNKMTVGVNMDSAPHLGLVKLDLLGLDLLDKAKYLQEKLEDDSLFLKRENWRSI